jgi:uncharacterized Tic20 family protein
LHQPPTDEERILAALSHAAIIANPFNLLGMVAAALIWYAHRQRSAYVADHAIHALVFQFAGLFVLMALGSMWGGGVLVSLLPVMLRPHLYRADWPISFWVALASGLVIIPIALAWLIAGCIGAWHAWHGRAFRYGLVGRLLRSHQGQAEAAEQRGDTGKGDDHAEPHTDSPEPRI